MLKYKQFILQYCKSFKLKKKIRKMPPDSHGTVVIYKKKLSKILSLKYRSYFWKTYRTTSVFACFS